MRDLVGYVTGLGVFSPIIPDVETLRAGSFLDAPVEPPAAIVHSRLRRGTSVLTRMSVEAVCQAAKHGRVDLAEAATVFGSAYGEICIAIEQLDMMREADGIVSPARFKNSVHNTAAGVLSIAGKNRGFTTALAGGAQTFAHTVLEALSLLANGAAHVVLVTADERLPVPLDGLVPYEPLAVAVAFSRERPSFGALAVLTELTQHDDGSAHVDLPSELERFRKNAASPALVFVRSVLEGKPRPIGLTATGDQSWSATLGSSL